MKKIKAKVNTRLLAKADRLFTGTVEGRVIELLQNARHGGAKKVPDPVCPSGRYLGMRTCHLAPWSPR